MTDNERYDAMRDEIIELKNTINRLEAENERLNKLAELGNMRANDYRAMRDKYLNAKAEAYKEFADRLKENFKALNSPLINNRIDNLLKEMVGEDNGN